MYILNRLFNTNFNRIELDSIYYNSSQEKRIIFKRHDNWYYYTLKATILQYWKIYLK
jgi:hypothetical protein